MGVLRGVAHFLVAAPAVGVTIELSFLKGGGGGGILLDSFAAVRLISLLKDFGVDLVSFFRSKAEFLVIGVKLFSLSTSRGMSCLAGEGGTLNFLE